MKKNIVKGDYVFVYGTLRIGGSNSLSGWGGVEYQGKTLINGIIHAVTPYYPGLVDATPDFSYEKPLVVGDLFLVTDDEAGRGMDRYEGYPSLYGRETVTCEKGTLAWVYTYNHLKDSHLIESGDWLAWTKEQDYRPKLRHTL